MIETKFQAEVAKLGLLLSAEQLKAFRDYADLLKEWNQKMNLTAITDDEGIYLKHFYDSLLSIRSFKYQGHLADVGSGAGFPGLVLKIAFPKLRVTLVEPLQKRCRFLNAVKEALNLEDLTILNVRSEDLAKTKRETYDIVTARAVANLSVLMELCAPLVRVGGHFIALKGPGVQDELKQAQKASQKLKLSLSVFDQGALEDEGQRAILIFKKDAKCPKVYPRPYGEIKRRPL